MTQNNLEVLRQNWLRADAYERACRGRRQEAEDRRNVAWEDLNIFSRLMASASLGWIASVSRYLQLVDEERRAVAEHDHAIANERMHDDALTQAAHAHLYEVSHAYDLAHQAIELLERIIVELKEFSELSYTLLEVAKSLRGSEEPTVISTVSAAFNLGQGRYREVVQILKGFRVFWRQQLVPACRRDGHSEWVHIASQLQGPLLDGDRADFEVTMVNASSRIRAFLQEARDIRLALAKATHNVRVSLIMS